MKLWLQIVIPLVVGFGAFFAIEPGHWNSIRSEAMLVLSVLAGAVLFRLGRGLPPVSVDYLQVDEVEKLARAYKTVSRRLAYVAGVTAVALIGLALIGILHQFIQTNFSPDLVPILGSTATAMLAALIAFAFCRAVVLVLGDLSSVAVQSDSIVKSVQRKCARKAEEELAKANRDRPFEKPTNYGKLI